jgi:adenylate cyclase
MPPKAYQRRLAAILSADVAGYSRLMGEDDDATVRTLTDYREVMTVLIGEHGGRVVDSPGDNLLAEFSSVLSAVDCAVKVQRKLRERNAEFPETRRLKYRIGINLGDVIEEGERIYGDGVNIAARLESLAEPGGISISGSVYSQVKSRLKLIG